MSWLSVILAAAAPLALGAEECSSLEVAHEELLKSSFVCERHFTLKMNGDLKVREVARVTYSDGEVVRETLEKRILSDNLILEERSEESALTVPFDCTLLESIDEGLVELSNAEGTERVVFAWDRANRVLRPIRWKNNEAKRFLWKKFVIEAVVEYKDFAWE